MSDDPSHKSKYRQALTLAAAGRSEEALAAVRDYLLTCPQDGEALNDAGALLYGLGRYDEAARHLELALRQLPDQRGQALRNLAEVYLAAGRPAGAAALFDALAQAAVLPVELVQRTVAGLLERDDSAGAVEALLRAMELTGPHDVLDSALARVHRLRPKVGLLGCRSGGGSGARLADFLRLRFRTTAFSGRTASELDAFLRCCDIAWFEGCTAEAVVASRRPKACRTIVHVGAEEAYRPCLEQVNWASVDLLATSAATPVREFLARRLPELARAGRIAAMPRGVEVPDEPPPDRPRGKHLACIGGLSLPRNPMLLLQCFRRLREADGDYRLFFAGYFQDDSLEAYVAELVRELHLADAVRFDGWQEDLPGWLADKHYVVAADIAESADAGVLEAMALGLPPVVHAFPGAAEIYGPQCLYRTPEEFCRRILDAPCDGPACRRFVRERYPVGVALRRAVELLTTLERQARAAGAPPAAPAPPDAARGKWEPIRPASGARKGADR